MDDIFRRNVGESIEAYQVRLTLMKQDGYDIDWSEIKELLGSDKNPDSIRKESYGIRIYDNYMEQKKFDNVSQETLDEINEKLLEIKKERVKVRDERNLVNNKIRQMARKESLMDYIKDEIHNLSLEKPMINEFTHACKSSGNDAVLIASDWHVGLEVENYLNKYNLDICKERVSKLCERTIRYCKLNNVDVLHCCFLGDLLSGEIHNILRLQNQLSLSEQLVVTSELVSEFIYSLSKEIKYVTVHLINGNHDRTIQLKNEALDRDTYLGVIREFVKLRIKDLSNVAFIDNTHDDEITTMNIKGYKFAAMHGHNINRSKDRKSVV